MCIAAADGAAWRFAQGEDELTADIGTTAGVQACRRHRQRPGSGAPCEFQLAPWPAKCQINDIPIA